MSDNTPQANQLTVPRYVYRQVERALETARARARLAEERVHQLEKTISAMNISRQESAAGGEDEDQRTEDEAQDES